MMGKQDAFSLFSLFGDNFTNGSNPTDVFLFLLPRCLLIGRHPLYKQLMQIQNFLVHIKDDQFYNDVGIVNIKNVNWRSLI